jgi:CheY-like chemotaxis protein
MSNKKILIVEDELITATDMKFRLEDMGYEIIGIVSDGAKAIETALSKKPDLVLMDVGLKGDMNGIEASQDILNEGINVIYLTGHDGQKILEESDFDNVNVIKKPFDDNEFKNTIEDSIGKSEVKIPEKQKTPKPEKKIVTNPEPKKPEISADNKETILVVEDEMITALDIKLRLEDFGYNVPGTIAYGEEAVEKAEEFKPDLILMDIMLKGEMNGIEATKEIQKTKDIPIIFLTANTNKEIIENALKTTPSGYISKPFNDRELKYIIEIAIKKSKDSKN